MQTNSHRETHPFIPRSVRFHPDIHRAGVLGDNFCLTWAADGHQYTAVDDGCGFVETPHHGFNGHWNNRVWRIKGGPHDFEGEFLPGYPDYPQSFPHAVQSPTGRNDWYAYGAISVDGVIYQSLTLCEGDSFSPFRGVKFLVSPDCGRTWQHANGRPAWLGSHSRERAEMHFLDEDGPRICAFSILEFLQYGRDCSLARDGYVYIYSPNGRPPFNNQLNLARCPRGGILDRGRWEYFFGYRNGAPHWTPHLGWRGIVHTFPEGYDWYSWHPSVIYNPGLDLYLMANGGTGRDRTWMHTLPGTLCLLWSKTPWGPWTEFYRDENWVMDNPDNRLYQPKLSPKWISADGRTLWLIFSDASHEWGKDGAGNYRWNAVEITLDDQP
jgi:hypothetical protein